MNRPFFGANRLLVVLGTQMRTKAERPTNRCDFALVSGATPAKFRALFMTQVRGQRWVSNSEPELGLGTIEKCEFGRVEVFFPAANERRQYSTESAPLRRVRFAAGDAIALSDGRNVVVTAVEEKAGLLVYKTAGGDVLEAMLSNTTSFSRPEDRLFAGQVDELFTFDLRMRALRRRCELRQSPVRGFVGGRVDLLPHQMSIATEVAARLVPRVLLADEVGLGKTIEAGLILHRLHLTGRAARILILLPEALVNQWFVELLRRFNLLFSIFDEDRCESIVEHDTEANPFLDSQLVLCDVNFLAKDPARARQAVDAGWDLLVVDEAHHLEWSPEAPGEQYLLVEQLAQKTPGLLLLTATPQQLGPEGHFARLRLLDPDRYSDLAKFMEEAEHYEQVARALDRLLAGEALSAADRKLFASQSPRIAKHLDGPKDGLVTELLDAFGTGRVMFRNTRAALTGFPKRKANLVELAGDDDTDAKVKWLAAFLKKHPKEKVLLICKTRKLVEQIAERLQREIAVNAGVFHEGLTLLQRDRNAAYFSEEDGARVLLCSEIGSEGRNFQFAHHLVLFDLPENPELLEQRIGRLDRIGQTATIKIHVPYLPESDGEVLAKWYHDGLDAFEHHPHGAGEIAAAVRKDLAALSDDFSAKKLTALVKKTKEQHAKLTRKLERGHDRLLELNSCKPAIAAATIKHIRAADADASFREFCVDLFDHFGVQVEDHSANAYLLKPGHLLTDAFPALPEEGITVTFDRPRALSREDLVLMSGDHPIMTGALDLLLGSEGGNSAFGVWKGSGTEAILLEIHCVAECTAPAALHMDRFLPPLPVRIVVDHALADQSADARLAAAKLEKADIFRLLDRGPMRQKLLPAMLAAAQALAAKKLPAVMQKASKEMSTHLDAEIERLETLRSINDHVRPEEIDLLRSQKAELATAISSTRMRLDSLRLILRTP
jgi:ATP-dependent helicase HepA